MKYLKRIGLGLSAFAVLFSLASLAMPAKAGATDLPDFNSMGGGDAARDKLLNASTFTVINRARINVDINLDENVFKSVTTGSVTYKEAFSGVYVDTDIGDSKDQWELPKKVIKSWGETKLYANGYLYTESDVPTVDTSTTDTTAWATQKVTLYLRLYLDDSGALATDAYSFFVDEVNDGDCNMGWHSHTCSVGITTTFDSNEDVIGTDDYRAPVAKLTNPEAIKIGYAFQNNTIVRVDDKETYSIAANSTGTIQRFFQPSSGGKVLFDTAWNSLTQEQVLKLFDCDTCTGTLDVKYGDENGSEKVRVAQAKSVAAETDGGDGVGVSDADIDLNCDFSIINPLSYFICPLIEMASSGINMLDSQINNQLAVPIGKDSAFDENNVKGGKSLYTAWASFRTIALAILVVIALVMVISQAISSGPFDSYTVKKVLPRIVVAVIFITLSWQLCKLLIGISNDFGKGVGSVIASPFGGLTNPTIGAQGQSIGTVAAIVGFFSGLDYLVVLSFMLTGLAAVMIAFLVVAFRNILIILLVITAPLALVLWILPNTQKAWGFWKTNFQAALLAFPIITAFIAIGRVFAILTSNLPAQNSSSLFRDVIVFFSYFGPYFALPAAFRLAGGAVASIGGMVNDRGKGFFDRNKKFRSTRKATNVDKLKNFSRFSDRSRIGHALNTVGGAANKWGRQPSSIIRGRAGITAARQTGRAAYGAEILKNDATVQAHGQDDNFLIALTDEQLAVRKLNEDIARRDAAMARSADMTLSMEERREAQDEVTSRTQSINARRKGLNAARQVADRKQDSVRLAAANALAKTGYQFSAGEDGYNELSSVMRSIVGNDEGAYAAAMDEAQYHLKNAGRFDLAGINHGAGYSPETGLGKASLYQLANSKKQSIEAMAATIPTVGPLTGDQMDKAAVIYQEMQAMRPNATGAVADEIDKQMEILRGRGVANYSNQASGRMVQEIDPLTNTPVIDPATGNPVMRQATVERRVNFDATNAAHLATWTPQEQARGWRAEQVAETNGDIARAKSRTYQPVDPNNIP